MNKFVFTFCIILLIAIKSEGQQRYAIIDRKLKQPIQYADAISDEQMKNGFFAVERQNIDPLVSKLDSLRKRLREVVREKYDETSFDIGTTKLTVKVIKFPVADRLNVGLSTNTGNGYTKEFYVSDGKLTNNDNARYLARLIKYIKSGS